MKMDVAMNAVSTAPKSASTSVTKAPATTVSWVTTVPTSSSVVTLASTSKTSKPAETFQVNPVEAGQDTSTNSVSQLISSATGPCGIQVNLTSPKTPQHTAPASPAMSYEAHLSKEKVISKETKDEKGRLFQDRKSSQVKVVTCLEEK